MTDRLYNNGFNGLCSNLVDLLLVLITFAFLFSIKSTNVLIGLFTLVMIIWIARGKGSSEKYNVLFLLLLPWVFEIISLLYTVDITEGIHMVEKKISLFIFPLAFYFKRGYRLSNAKSFVAVLFLAVVLATGYCVLIGIWKFVTERQNVFYWYDFTQPIGGFHPSYLSLLINFLTFWLLEMVIKNTPSFQGVKMIGVLVTLGYFGLLILILSSKIHLVIFLIIVISGIYYFVRSRKFTLFLAVIPLILMAIMLLAFKGNLAKRYGSIRNWSYELNAPVDEFNELTIRLALLDCSWRIIRDNPVFGVGVGDVMNELDAVYRSVDYKFGYLDHQDPHNQYVRIMLGTGLFGLLFFTTSLTAAILIGLKEGNHLLIGFVVIFSISFLFESVLERHNGIVIYSILISVMIFGTNGRQQILHS